jgi:uncharacterized membrane protein
VDRGVRAVLGPALVAWGAADLRRSPARGAAAMVAGALIAESALTRVCPLNEALGVDTARRTTF